MSAVLLALALAAGAVPSALVAAAVPAPLQDGDPKPLPAGVLARLGERNITRDEYLDYLYLRIGKRAIREYATDLIVEQEAARYGITADEAEVARQVEAQEQQARGSPRAVDFEQELQMAGQSLEMFRASKARDIRRDLLLGELVRATRVVTDERLRQEFEAKYGTGGVKVQLRQILIMPNVLKSEQIRGGKKPNEINMDELKAQARQMAADALGRVRGGEDFATVAAAVSHDQTTKQKGGEIPNYDGRLYGTAFRDAVMQLQPGQVSDVVESGAGFHVIQLSARTDTRLEDVRATLVAEILASEPSWQEKQGLMQALQSSADLQLW
ncbi:MAG: hypothetical protein EYC70_04805 [Planctomycetota bacterium]|nr:MAG: hypothetical protein EYC70_04805 [Planctomycetota bacterium]